MSTVHKVLAEDLKNRKPGVTNGLHTLKTLDSNKTLDYDLPTLVPSSFDYSKTNQLCTDIDIFKTKFYNQYPFLSGLNMKNLLIAGGSVGNIIMGKTDRFGNSSDVDFFVYGLSEKDANLRVTQWVIDIINCAKKHVDNNKKTDKQKPKKSSEDDVSYDVSDDVEYEKCKKYGKRAGVDDVSDDVEEDCDDMPKKGGNQSNTDYESKIDCEMIRNNNTLLIKLFGIEVQLIFRLYKTKSEILHGFDLGSSSVGYDGKQVYLTTLGKFCYEHTCNIIDTTRRSTTYEYRLEKYFNRGFNIVFPKLDIKKLRKEYFKFGNSEMCIMPYFVFSYNEIVGNRITVNVFYNKYGKTSDYGLDEINEYNSCHMNLFNLISGSDFFFYTSRSIDIDHIEVLNKPPRMTKGQITNFYEEFKNKIKKNNINVLLLKKYFPSENISNIVNKLLEDDSSAYMNKLVEKHTKSAIAKLTKLEKKDHSKINWLTQNPGTQLSGSFNPIIEDEDKWYGVFYLSGKK